MQSQQTFQIRHLLSHANQLMRESKGSTSDAENMSMALQSYQTAVEDFEYATLDYPTRLAIHVQLNELIKHLPDKKDDILNTMIKQVIAEIKHFQLKESDDLVLKIIGLICSEQNKVYLDRLFEQYDALRTRAEVRLTITKEMLKLRLAHLKTLYSGQGEKSALAPFYKKIFLLYPTILNLGDMLPILVANLQELICIPEHRQEILDLIETTIRNNHHYSIPFLNLLLNEPDHCVRLLNEKKLTRDLVQYITKHATNPLILFHAHQKWITYCDKWQVSMRMQSIKACEEQAKKLGRSFDLKEYLDDFIAYARQEKTVETYLKAANLGDIDSRIEAAKLLQNTNLDQAVEHYLQAFKEALQTKEKFSVIKSILWFKEKFNAKLSAAQQKQINDAIFPIFKDSDLFGEEYCLWYLVKWLNDSAQFLSFEAMNAILTGLEKKYGHFVEFLAFAENYYSKKFQEKETQEAALPRFTDYQQRHATLKERVAEVQGEIKALGEKLQHSELTIGRQLVQWIQEYAAKQECDVHSTLLATMEAGIIKLLDDKLRYINSPAFDFVALLNTLDKSERAIRIQTKLIETIFFKYDTSYRNGSFNFLYFFNYQMFFSAVSTLDAKSPFYHFVETAKSQMKTLQNTSDYFKRRLFDNVVCHFAKPELAQKWGHSAAATLNLSKLVGCPIALALDIHRKVETGKTSRHALLACATLLVLAKKRDLMADVTRDYLPLYDSWYSNLYAPNKEVEASRSKEKMLKALKSALSTAQTYLTSRATSKIFKKHQGLAQHLLEFVHQAETAPEPIANPILFLVEKKKKSAIKEEDLADFDSGLVLMMVNESKDAYSYNFTPLEQTRFFAVLDNFLDAQMTGYSVITKPSAPHLEEKQMPAASAPLEVKTKQLDEKKEQAASFPAPDSYPLPTARSPEQAVSQQEPKQIARSPEIVEAKRSKESKTEAASVQKIQRRLVTKGAAATEREPGASINPVTACIEITESSAGILSVSPKILSELPVEITFILFSNHLLLELHAADSEVSLDAPEGSAPLAISVKITDEVKNNLRVLETSVIAADTTPATLELSFFSQKMTVSGGTPLRTQTSVKTCGKT